jgi:hypothetical protein
MLFIEKIALYFENCTKLLSTTYGRNAKVVTFKYVVYIDTTALKVLKRTYIYRLRFIN